MRIVGITETAARKVRSILKDASNAGVGIDEAKRMLRREFEDMATSKAEMIARTEVIGSSNAANLAAYQISGLVDGKEWLAVQDDVTRDSHRAIDGQRTTIRGEFVTPSGDSTQGPGLFGIAEEDINCRCTVRPVIADLVSPTGEARAVEWRKFVSDTQPFEDDIRDGMAEVFAGWLSDAIQALG